jgi:hypothetical protein
MLSGQVLSSTTLLEDEPLPKLVYPGLIVSLEILSEDIQRASA